MVKRQNSIREFSVWREVRMVCVLAIVLSMGIVEAQNNLNQPYSQYGVGMNEMPYNMPMATRMGGAVYTLSGTNFINPFNPASYGGVESESFVFDMGVNIQISTIEDGSQRMRNADGNLGHLLIGFPLTKWWKVAAGMLPYSTVDYKSVVKNKGATTTYDGFGGVNEFFIGSAFNLLNGKNQQLQVGFNVGYLSGTTQRAITYAFTDSLSRNSRKQKDTWVGNVVVDFGVQYWHALNEYYKLGVGLNYKPYMELSISEQAMIYTYTQSGSSEVLLDTIFPSRGESTDMESHLVQPHTFGIGLSLERSGLWQVMVNATFANGQGLKYVEDEARGVFGDNKMGEGLYSQCAIGFEKKVRMDASRYLGRIGWSIGVHSGRGMMYLNIDGREQRVDRWGAGMGASLPMRKGKSLLTLSVGYNSFGSEELIKCSAVTFGMAVSSCERWFVKRKYN